jgi:putative transposase
MRAGLAGWISYYNAGQPHSALASRKPDEAYGAGKMERLAA